MKTRLPDGPTSGGESPVRTADLADVTDIWRIFRSRRRTIFTTVAVFLAAGTAYAVFDPSQYKATAELFIDPRDKQIVSKDVNPDTLAADGGLLQIESQARVIESDSVLLRAVDSAGLDRDPDFGGDKTSLIGGLVQMILGDRSGNDVNARRNKALRVLRKNLAVRRADRVFVVDVTVAAGTAARAAQISDAVAEAYIADQIAARGDSSRRASDALAARLSDLRESVRDAENKVERYKATHDIVGSSRELVSDQQLDDSGIKLANAHTRSEELRARIDQIEALRRSGGDAGSMPEALQSSVITQLRASAQDLVRRESDLRTRVGERHPDLIALVQQVQEVKRQINAELDRLARGAKTDYDRAIAYEKSLSVNLDKSKQKTLAMGQDSVELRELTRELEARRSLYQTFLGRAAETKAQADINTFNARIISKAIPPEKPSWPPRPFVVLGALFGGLGLGAGLALLLEFLGPTILSPAQLERLSEAPVVGVFEARRGRRPARAVALKSDNEVVLALSRLCGPLGGLRGSPEPYCLLLTSSLTDSPARIEALDRVAAVAEDRGISTLLVDTTLASSPDGTKGFFDVINGDCSITVAAQPYGAKGTKMIVMGGERGANLRNLRDSQMRQFIVEAGRYFDLILFDGGACDQNPAVATLAAHADDVLLIAVRGVTSQQAARDTCGAILAFTGHPVSASVLMQAAA